MTPGKRQKLRGKGEERIVLSVQQKFIQQHLAAFLQNLTAEKRRSVKKTKLVVGEMWGTI